MNAEEIPADLDLLGGLMGTDKSSAAHNFLVHYDGLFRDFRHLTFNFIEIGVFTGASLETWRGYFDKANIIGVDINENCRQYSRAGIIVEIGSQYDAEFLADLVGRYPPRIIIDDGSHMAHHIIFTFETMFPTLEPGGIYVVEDLNLHAGDHADFLRGPAEINPIDYFLAMSRMLIIGELEPTKRGGFASYALETIDEILVFGHAVAIRKKAPRTDTAERLAAMTVLAERIGTADAWERACKYFVGNGDLRAAIPALEKAIEIDPRWNFYRLMGLLHSSLGNYEAAIQCAEISVQQATDPSDRGDCLDILGNLLVAARRIEEGVRVYQNALEITSHPVRRANIEQKIDLYANRSGN